MPQSVGAPNQEDPASNPLTKADGWAGTAVEAAASERGCGAVELTSSSHQQDAHRFCLAAGYQGLPHRFLKQLDPAHDQDEAEDAPEHSAG